MNVKTFYLSVPTAHCVCVLRSVPSEVLPLRPHLVRLDLRHERRLPHPSRHHRDGVLGHGPLGCFGVDLVNFTGFTQPPPQMHPWFGWIRWINSIFYAFEILVANEFHIREFTCSAIMQLIMVKVSSGRAVMQRTELSWLVPTRPLC
jgi:hypothetical protein